MAEVGGAGLDMFGGDTDSDSSEASAATPGPGSMENTAQKGGDAAGGFLGLVEGTVAKPEAGSGGGGGRGGGGATVAGDEGKAQEIEEDLPPPPPQTPQGGAQPRKTLPGSRLQFSTEFCHPTIHIEEEGDLAVSTEEGNSNVRVGPAALDAGVHTVLLRLEYDPEHCFSDDFYVHRGAHDSGSSLSTHHVHDSDSIALEIYSARGCDSSLKRDLAATNLALDLGIPEMDKGDVVRIEVNVPPRDQKGVEVAFAHSPGAAALVFTEFARVQHLHWTEADGIWIGLFLYKGGHNIRIV